MGRTQLNIRIDEEEKREWKEEYVPQARWDDTLSDFVKRAVREKIDRMDAEGGGGSNFDIQVDPDAVSGAGNDEVLERLQNLRNDFRDLQADVSDAVDAVHAQQGLNPDVSPDVYQALPTAENDALTAEDLADATGYGHATVRFALENMRRSTGVGVWKLVEVANEAGETEWVEGDAENISGYSTNADPLWYKSEGA